MKLLNYIVEWSLNNRIIVLILTFFFILYGIANIHKLKLDAIPDVTNIQVQIVTSAPTLSSLEMEQYVTYPVEWGVSGIPDIKEIRSISRYGLSLVTIVFNDDLDLMVARQLVSERMLEIQKQIPTKYGTPQIGPLSTALGEVIQFTLTSEKHTSKELTTTLQWYISPLLKTVPGVVEVNIFGGETKQYAININLKSMQSLAVNTEDIMNAVDSNNISEGGGYIEHKHEHTIIGVQSLLKTKEDFQSIYIKNTKDGNPIYLKNVATITESYELRKGAATQNGNREVVGGMALMLIGENSLDVSEAVKEKLKFIEPTLEDGMEFNIFYDRSKMVWSTIYTVMKNLGEGAIFVVIILFLLLGNLRSGLIIAVIIPLCMLFAILIMIVREAPANLMSMGAIDFGLLVDGAVIVVENATRRLSIRKNELKRELSKEEKRETILDATIEVRKATIFGEIIIGIVYIPILALSGTEGKLFIPMALTVIYAISGAFIFTLTIVPVLADIFLKIPEGHKEETKLFEWIQAKYNPMLRFSLKHRMRIVSAAVGFFLFTIILFPFLGAEFIPTLDEGSTLLEINRLPSASLEESIRSTLKIERILLTTEFPEIKSVVSKTGSPNLSLEPMGIEKSDVFIQLNDRSTWERSRSEFLSQIAETIEREIPEISFGISQPIEMRTNEMVAGIRSDIGVKIFGEDILTLRKLGEETADRFKNIPGVKDIRIEQLGGISFIKVIPNREKMARYGVDAKQIGQLLQMISSGLNTSQLIDGAKRFNIALKLQNPPNESLESWQPILIPSRNQGYIPLGDIAEIRKEDGPAQISHEWQERRLLVEFNVRDRDVMSVVSDVEKILSNDKILPPGYRFELDGTFKNYLSARNTLLWVVPITFAMILFLLWLAIQDMTSALLLFINIPFAIAGGILALFMRSLPFSISAGIGFIALFGVAVLNGLVLVTFSKQLEKKNMTPMKAIEHAALLRVRPVLMTGMVAILGFIPMALSTNPGAEVQRPLATVLIGGLITNALLTLLVFPAFYSLVYDKILSLTPASKKQT
ncbi:MAG: efflux RND transporter permease subunit [Leptospira sp.]|nr:efflux RND transporter permease subunit [Leptospira sp.]NCS92410.1 efflux RND transporter permease subunit [Leptospira sp.]